MLIADSYSTQEECPVFSVCLVCTCIGAVLLCAYYVTISDQVLCTSAVVAKVMLQYVPRYVAHLEIWS